MKDIDGLRDVRHTYSVAVLVKDVEVNARNKSVTDRVLLVEESGVCAFLDIIPAPPLVNHKCEYLPRIVFVHDVRVLRDDLVHLECLKERDVPLFIGEIGRAALVIPVVGKCVIMQ